jgi:hypothetical protein
LRLSLLMFRAKKPMPKKRIIAKIIFGKNII